jgi:UDP-N-acetyl-alpha-D-muramoyl-L-alanyl-L-glutamate epimerase
MSNNQNIFNRLRRKFPVFGYEDFHWNVSNNALNITYHFALGAKYQFFPKYNIPLNNWGIEKLSGAFISNIVFHIGMVEMISYWKASCSPKIFIKPYRLKNYEQEWWRKLIFNGLGEFLFLNGIETSEKKLVSFLFHDGARKVPRNIEFPRNQRVLVPIGGGKDSLASLNILSQDSMQKVAFAINPGQATLDSVRISGLENSFFIVNRTIDPLLLELNSQGFLNGHTPFSALLAFVSLLAASITDCSHIALSNESSANEPTIPGTEINHQYSKSYVFEKDFRKFVLHSITKDINYFSLLRPLNELQIAAIFSGNPEFLRVFKSCNVGSKTNSWCCNCPKCLFTYIMLSAFVDSKQLVEVFGENLLEKESLIPLLDQLSGLTPEKPFECIGTIEEVNAALGSAAMSYCEADMPLLLRHHRKHTSAIRFSTVSEQLNYWNWQYNIGSPFESLIKQSLERARTQYNLQG